MGASATAVLNMVHRVGVDSGTKKNLVKEAHHAAAESKRGKERNTTKEENK